MRKILIINTTFDKGGAAIVAKSIFEGFKNDFDIWFAFGRGKKVNCKKTFYFGNFLEKYIHVFIVRFLGLEGFGTYFQTRKLISFIKREKFELIHLHNLHGYYLNFFKLIKFLQQEKIPVVWTLHDEWATTWLPAYTNSNQEKSYHNKWLNYKDVYPKNYFPIFKKFMLKKKAKVISNNWKPFLVCPSEWLKSKIKISYLRNYNIEVINNGIDTEIFKPLEKKRDLRLKYNLPVDGNIILFVAANLNDKRKGISDIIGAAKTLDDNCFFIGAGSGKVEDLHNLKIFNYIHNKDELAELYCLSDIFCFASSAETFLLTVAESLSCGTPVVGYKIPVVSEIFREDVGILVDKNDKKSLAQSIRFLLNDSNLRLKMGICGRKLILENYSKDLFYKRYFDLYNK